MILLHEGDVMATGKKLSKSDLMLPDLQIARKLYGHDVHHLSVKLITKLLSKGKTFYGLSGQGWTDGDDSNIQEFKFKGFVSGDNEYDDASGAHADYEKGDSVCLKTRGKIMNAHDCNTNGSMFSTGGGCDPVMVFARKETKTAKKSRKAAEADFASYSRKEMAAMERVVKKLKKSPTKSFSKVLKMLEKSRKRK
jgi:hypothetical protein